MRILITGSSGFIARNLQSRLASHLKAYTLLGEKYEFWAMPRGESATHHLAQCDPDVIINCAADIYDSNAMFGSNVVLTRILTEWCVAKDIPIIHFGSSSEYGCHAEPTTETSELRIDGLYAGTKAAATYIVQGMLREQTNGTGVILRLYSPFGPWENPRRFFPRMYRAHRYNEYVRIYNNVHDYMYIDDVTDAVVKVFDKIVFDKERYEGEIFNLCSGVQTCNLDVAAIFEKHSDHKIINDINVKPSNGWPVWVGDNSKFCKEFDWKPKWTIEEGIADFIKNASYAKVL